MKWITTIVLNLRSTEIGRLSIKLSGTETSFCLVLLRVSSFLLSSSMSTSDEDDSTISKVLSTTSSSFMLSSCSNLPTWTVWHIARVSKNVNIWRSYWGNRITLELSSSCTPKFCIVYFLPLIEHCCKIISFLVNVPVLSEKRIFTCNFNSKRIFINR